MAVYFLDAHLKAHIDGGSAARWPNMYKCCLSVGKNLSKMIITKVKVKAQQLSKYLQEAGALQTLKTRVETVLPRRRY